MDNQLKRGLLDVCVLAAIKNEDSYGYQIIKDMKPYLEMSESTLYTILKRLETAELLTVRSAEHDGRLRKEETGISLAAGAGALRPPRGGAAGASGLLR